MTNRERGQVLDTDDAYIAVLLAAMDASGHTSADEAERAHHIIWSTRRFRDRDGAEIDERIERVRTLLAEQGTAPVLDASASAIPDRLRPAVFAVAADLVLVDGRLERLESEFLRRLAGALDLDAADADRILDVIRIKNSA
jgi:tellurite resistance protein